MRDWDAEVQRYLEQHPQRSFKVKDLQRALRVPASRYGQFRARVLGMARSGRIALLPRRRVQALAGARLLEGEVLGIGGRATHVRLGDGRGRRLPLVPTERLETVPGDRVRVRVVRVEGTRMARVQRVLHATSRTVFGTLMRVRARWTLVPDTPIPGLAGSVFLAQDPSPQAADGNLARGRLPAFDPATQRPELLEVEPLGPADHPRPAMARRLALSAWPLEFGPAAREEARRAPPETLPRRDLSGLLAFTIDPTDAKDHDDAVSIETTADGGFLLGVHIADVAAFVPLGGALDREARERATSVYPPGSVVPMLPEQLSAGACSLHHGVPRRCLSVLMRYDEEGRRQAVSFGVSRIRSRATLAYEHAEAMLEGDGAAVPGERSEVAVDSLAAAVRTMHELAQRLRQRRQSAGSLFLERPERRFHFDAEGHVDSVESRPTLRSHRIIEEFMLEANRAVAEILDAAGLPLIWRVHASPAPEKLDDLVALLEQLGVFWNPPEPVRGTDFADLFALVEGRALAPLVHLLALRSLMKAQYSASWQGHFGLAFDRYAHFTSPIRRYPDLHNARWLHALLQVTGSDGWLEDALGSASRSNASHRVDAAAVEEASRLGEHCSRQERRAMEIERDTADICAADSLRNRIGETLEGMIVSLVPSGVFVELEPAGLDGFVGVEELPGDWYTLDERRHRFLGQRTGRSLAMGHRVRVLLEHVDVANGRVWLGGLEPLG